MKDPNQIQMEAQMKHMAKIKRRLAKEEGEAIIAAKKFIVRT